MTITNRDMNTRLSNLEACAEYAPSGTYAMARSAIVAIEDAQNEIRMALNLNGFLAMGDDRLRNLEVAIYEYMLGCNHGATELAVAEGFGAAMGTPARERVIAQAERDRDALAALKTKQGAVA
jgi:hypothetical protein